MIREAIDRVLELNRPETVDVDGRTYSTSTIQPIREPLARPLDLKTLSGLVDWFNSSDKPEKCIVHIRDYNEVSVLGYRVDPWKERDAYIIAQCEAYNTTRESYKNIDEFIIFLQTAFEETDDQIRIIASLGNVRTENVTTASDDGITQAVTVKNKVGRLEEIALTPVVELRPYRTFRDVQQPVSKYLFRMRRGEEGCLPTAALFLADGGSWKLDAIENIKSYLKYKLPKDQEIIG